MATKKDREELSEYVDVSRARLNDDDVSRLREFIDNKEDYQNNPIVKEQTYSSWSSEGKFRRTERDEYLVEDDYSITHNYSYRDDDGQTGKYSENFSGARDIINILKDIF